MMNESISIKKDLDCNNSDNGISLVQIFKRFKSQISVTFILVLIESVLGILFPLFIGWAINDLLDNQLNGLYWLAALGFSSLIIGSARRLYDTRTYSKIYQQVATERVEKEKTKQQTVSTISARTSLLTELVEFLENSMPEVINVFIGIIGTLFIVVTMNVNVFYACFSLALLVSFVYLITGRFNYQLNANYNEELENQVKTLEQNDMGVIKLHFKNLMKWNIKLSDLETINYFIIWLGVIALLLYTPVSAIGMGVVDYGLVFSLMIYVFQYIELIVALPLFIQQLIRLKEISNRLSR
ncbi:ABC transporter six-transmembrane domain-containing protein [Pseudoalteromonas denitrificans]|uniref:ABC transporter transmembrane region n=1 Tax=Pseudoalteromonas denitrificans DSM 6059 TaxID=1123010 RepID=A0A1I1RRZ4_9GAMM|nr:ABC transporter six-transmembrane domain-containing protein [Pseudoalteromonas denitrificans]SFD37051.1 ABC transporter transmembrane region [Pseudoalteromonas denitrificans DSM 6059]